MKAVWFYSDWRVYLQDWLADRRERGVPASNRYIAQKMGINSASWLTSISQGKKGLSRQSANKLSSVIGHSPDEARFFETMVSCDQATGIDERNNYHRELGRMRQARQVQLLADTQFEYYGQWYHSVIRALIGAFGFDGNIEKLAANCLPPISTAQAKSSVALLEKLGLVQKKETGEWILPSTAVKSGAGNKDAVENFQREAMRLAQEALDRFSPMERDISTLTIGVSDETAGKIRELISNTRRRIVELANADETASRVWQINFQVFPFSKPVASGEV